MDNRRRGIGLFRPEIAIDSVQSERPIGRRTDRQKFLSSQDLLTVRIMAEEEIISLMVMITDLDRGSIPQHKRAKNIGRLMKNMSILCSRCRRPQVRAHRGPKGFPACRSLANITACCSRTD